LSLIGSIYSLLKKCWKHLPGYFVFGNNKGLELFVFNMKEQKPWKVYYVDNISMTQEDVLECAVDFKAFVEAMGRTTYSE
jgi:hypothetical protein